MKSKRGSISIEAVIGLSTLVLFFSFLVQVLLLYGFHDQTSQKIYDEINRVSHYHYIYESIGPLEASDYAWIKSKMPGDIEILINESLDLLNDKTKAVFLREILSKKIEKIKHSKIKELGITDFSLEEHFLSVKVSFIQVLPLGFEVAGYVQVDKQLWFLGSHPEQVDLKTLSSILKENHDNQANTYVYMTKTGSKYHLEDCFYITRSTTDQKALKKITLDQAEKMYDLSPCSRCILKGWTLWK